MDLDFVSVNMQKKNLANIQPSWPNKLVNNPYLSRTRETIFNIGMTCTFCCSKHIIILNNIVFIATKAACVDVKQDSWPVGKTSQVYNGKDEREGTTNTIRPALVSRNIDKFSYSYNLWSWWGFNSADSVWLLNLTSVVLCRLNVSFNLCHIQISVDSFEIHKMAGEWFICT